MHDNDHDHDHTDHHTDHRRAEHAIRPAARGDREAVADLAVSTHLFGPDDVGSLLDVFDGTVDGDPSAHQWWVSLDPDGGVTGAAYVATEPFADRLWNLYFLAVSPTRQARGAGTGLVEHVQARLRSAGEEAARVLVVETSSTALYDGARAFYRARGFDEEARIRDFYGPGDHKVVFWRSLVD